MQFIAEKNGWTKFVSMQNRYNLCYREEERDEQVLQRDWCRPDSMGSALFWRVVKAVGRRVCQAEDGCCYEWWARRL